MQDEVLLREDVLSVNAVQDEVLLKEDVLLVNAVLVALSALVWVSVRRRLEEQPVLFDARIGSWCQRVLRSPVGTTNDLDLEPKGDYELYGYNNRIYYHEVVHGGGIEGQDSVASPGASRGWTWRTGPSDTAQVPRTCGRVQQ